MPILKAQMFGSTLVQSSAAMQPPRFSGGLVV